ncbi:hypothetical protein [Salinisphaera hydrothermalis]|uniref:Uncharacterized protein n=1 Tax=Salinisphaera hydrothermalis (strain C41B8) TaxID=1304275 RepID=A0A084IRN2_SALHC|nr:hypothetical protein [Salinisphaera hydrothermalis]KEZ79366.1 hypothetical protein C41B8_01415 [Salinisphaera hydrothermalis C41B8]
MWEFFTANAKALSVVASFGTMVVWVFYAHLLYQAFKRQRQARILINQGWGEQINSVAIVSNMSHEPVYIQCVVLSLKLEDGRKFRDSVTDFDDAEPWNAKNDPQEITRQGPLNTGSYMNLGTFQTLLRQSGQQHDLIDGDENPVKRMGVRNFKLTVICNYGPSGEAIGVQRKFVVHGENSDRLRPDSIYSRRLTNRRARRKMERWLSEQVQNAARGEAGQPSR